MPDIRPNRNPVLMTVLQIRIHRIRIIILRIRNKSRAGSRSNRTIKNRK